MSEICGDSDSMDIGASDTSESMDISGSELPDSMDIGSTEPLDSTESGTDVTETAPSDGTELLASGAEGLSQGSEFSSVTDEAAAIQPEISASKELSSAQAQVEQVHSSTCASILERDGNYISARDQARIEEGPTNIQVVESLGSGKTGAYHFDSRTSSIRVASLTETQRERSAIHETYHFASKNREIIVPMPEKDGYMVHNTVGTRHASWFHSAKTGENFGYTEHGRGLNEGITTMLTNRELASISPEKGREAEQQQIYGHATDLVASLEQIVGESALKEAFYGGNTQGLENKVNSLAGENEFTHLRDCLDRSISRDYAERVTATREAQEILARMEERSKALS